MHLPTLPLLLLAAILPLALADTPPVEELKIETTFPVTCTRKSAAGDSIEVHYRGTLASTGAEFDASHNRGAPFAFKLGAKQVIQGWDQGLQGMCIGEKRTLTIPPHLGYGERGMGPIPPGSTLVFETELMGIQGVEREAPGEEKGSYDEL
ncbi:MAG: Peptidyl-prolyl cis-trans isomerase fpr2 [Trizodia sp. TS-e1964]|nr:MAG: Peptidyl-prolyl cis-trans isomerase fpr2 [Trizodia sp. TS-e1964]